MMPIQIFYGDPLSAHLMVEAASRSRGLTYAPPHHIIWAGHIDAGYCLDAPNELPGGGCFQEEFEDVFLPSQVTIPREQ